MSRLQSVAGLVEVEKLIRQIYPVNVTQYTSNALIFTLLFEPKLGLKRSQFKFNILYERELKYVVCICEQTTVQTLDTF